VKWGEEGSSIDLWSGQGEGEGEMKGVRKRGEVVLTCDLYRGRGSERG
jgi:hypothetical protein